MVLNKIVKFGDINPSSHYYFEKAVNDVLCDLEREGCFIMNVRFERYAAAELSVLDGKLAVGNGSAYFFAYILYNKKRNGIEKLEDRSKPVLQQPEGIEALDRTYKGVDMYKAPVELKAIFERLTGGKDVSKKEIKELDEYVFDMKTGG